METALAFLKALVLVVVIVGGLVSLFLWWKSGFWAPAYIHAIAIIAALVGALLALLAWNSDHPMKEKHLWFVVIFPAAVYLLFGLYGGGTIKRHLEDKQRDKDGAA